MKLMVYCSSIDRHQTCQPLLHGLHIGLEQWDIDLYTELDLMFEQLRTPAISADRIVVMVIHSEHEANEIIENRELLRGLELILIMPEEPGEIGTRAWLIEPRLSFFGLPSAEAVCAILRRMAQRISRRPILEARNLRVGRQGGNLEQ